MSKLKAAGGGTSKPRLLVGYRGDFGDFDVFAVNSDTGAKTRLRYWTHGQFPDGAVKKATWTAELLMAALQPTLRRFFSAYGGHWHIEMSNAKQESPENHPKLPGNAARDWVIKDILNGPDGPGKRFLLNRNCKFSEAMALPADVAAPAKTVASRETLDRLDEPLPDERWEH